MQQNYQSCMILFISVIYSVFQYVYNSINDMGSEAHIPVQASSFINFVIMTVICLALFHHQYYK